MARAFLSLSCVVLALALPTAAAAQNVDAEAADWLDAPGPSSPSPRRPPTVPSTEAAPSASPAPTAPAAPAAPAATPAAPAQRSPWHFDLDGAYEHVESSWLLTPVTMGMPTTPPADVARTQTCDALRIAFAIAHADLAVEGSYTMDVSNANKVFESWSAGLRLDSGWQSTVSLQFRAAFVQRLGLFAGNGGRLGLSVVVRPFDWVQVYADAMLDVAEPPSTMTERGIWVTYSTHFGAGARFSLNP